MQKRPDCQQKIPIGTEFDITHQEIAISPLKLIEGLRNQTNVKQLNMLAEEFFKKFVGHVHKMAMYGCGFDADAAKDMTLLTMEFAFENLRKPDGFKLPEDSPLEKHELIIKAWLGRVVGFKCKKAQSEKNASLQIKKSLADSDEVICPNCGDLLQNDGNLIRCAKGHYEIESFTKRYADKLVFEQSENPEGQDEIQDSGQPDELNQKMQAALENLSPREKAVYQAYIDEGCIDSNLHLKDSTMSELCLKFETNATNIRQIKRRTIQKIIKYCQKL